MADGEGNTTSGGGGGTGGVAAVAIVVLVALAILAGGYMLLGQGHMASPTHAVTASIQTPLGPVSGKASGH